MLNEKGIEYRYREYRKEPLSAPEIQSILDKSGLLAGDLLRVRYRANAELGLSGAEPADRLIEEMAKNPTLIQRPIGVLGDRAVVGRPPERLLEL